jgi:YVTN family beta-propeller protein
MRRVAAVSSLLIPLGLGVTGDAEATMRSTTLAVTPDGGLLAVANADAGSLTLLDTTTLAVLAEVPVGRSPRAVALDAAGERAFVTGRGDDSLAVVDLVRWRAVARRSVDREPGGVVAGMDGRVYVAATGAGRVLVYEARTLAPLGIVATEPAPDGLALAGDGRTLYVTHASTGQLTLVDTATLAVRRVIATTSDVTLAGAATLDEPAGRAYVPATRANSVSPALVFDNTLLPIVDVFDLAGGQQRPQERIAIDLADRPASRPSDVLLAGGRLWVVHAGSGDLSVIDLATGRAVGHLDVGENPTGIVASPDGVTVYVHAALDGMVRVVDAATFSMRTVVPVTRSPLPATVHRGKVLFHTSRPPAVARDRWISCAGCHVDGRADRRTWAFPDGPRNTTSLLGVRDTLPVHWSGDLDELQDVETTVRTLQAGTGLAPGASNCEPACDQAPPNAGRSQELDDLAAFMRSLRPRPSPHLVDGGLAADAQRGRSVFARSATGCTTCHPPPLYTDRRRHDVGTGGGAGERKGRDFDTPSLRSLFETAPYLHDGRAATLEDVLTSHNAEDRHGRTSQLGAGELADLVAFLRALPFEPADDECAPDGETLCLLAGHLRARATFTDPRDGSRKPARAVRLADGGGGFSFFDGEALDVVLKSLDSRPLGSSLWTFAGSLTSVDWEVTVSLPGTAIARTFRAGDAGCGFVDAATLPPPAEPSAATVAAAAAGGGSTTLGGRRSATAGPAVGCAPSPTTLCLLGDRFRVEAAWRNPRDGTGGPARALPLLDGTGFFSFFDRGNPEVAVKVVDGRRMNGSFWLFDGRLTDLEYELVVTDTTTGTRRTYQRPAQSLCGGVDLGAFLP